MARVKGAWPSPRDMARKTVARIIEESEARGMSTNSYIHEVFKTYWAGLETERRWSAGHHESVSREQPNEYPVRMPSGRG